MKTLLKFMVTSLSIIVVLFLNSNLVFCTPCSGCTTWTPSAYPIVVSDGGTCTYLVYYSTCTSSSDKLIQIDKILPQPTSGCNTLTVSQATNLAIKGLLQNSAGIFKFTYPGPGQVPYNVDIFTPACVQYETSSSSYVQGTCTTGCCDATYSTLYVNGCATVTGYNTSGNSCSLIQGTCDDACSGLTVSTDVCLDPPGYSECACGGEWEGPASVDLSTFSPGPPPMYTGYGYYLVHTCPNGKIEFMIYRLEIPCSQNKGNSFNVTAQLIIKAAGLTFPSGPVGGIVRHTSPTCMKLIASDGTFCTYEDCNVNCNCNYEWHVVNDGTNVTATTLPGNSTTCSLNSDPDCNISVCNHNPTGTFYPKIAINDGGNTIFPANETNSFVVPNPSDNNVDIHILSPDKGEALFEIYDVSGNKIREAKINKTNSEGICKLDLKQIRNGFYNYLIRINGNLLSSGSFIVTH